MHQPQAPARLDFKRIYGASSGWMPIRVLCVCVCHGSPPLERFFKKFLVLFQYKNDNTTNTGEEFTMKKSIRNQGWSRSLGWEIQNALGYWFYYFASLSKSAPPSGSLRQQSMVRQWSLDKISEDHKAGRRNSRFVASNHRTSRAIILRRTGASLWLATGGLEAPTESLASFLRETQQQSQIPQYMECKYCAEHVKSRFAP